MRINCFEFKHIAVIIFTSLIITMLGCEEKKTENKAPICSITNPDNGEEVQQGDILTISVDANDEDGKIAEVCFYIDGSEVGISSSSPYNYDWNTSSENKGSHTLKVTAKDDSDESTSDEIAIFLANGTTSSVSDYDGNTYDAIKLGTQWWMAENLKTTHYANGNVIQMVTDNATWGAFENTDKAMCYYGNLEINKGYYGALYTWAAAMNGTASSNSIPSGIQGACPDGWHLPSDKEWKKLEMYLGMLPEEADKEYTIRGTNEGSKLAGNPGLWAYVDVIESDAAFGTSNFMALPGGYRDFDGAFTNMGYTTVFWTATEDNGTAWYRRLDYNYSGVSRHSENKEAGYSVRCVKD